jgi:tetratricopeptide (TPR) repeat protein
LEKAIEIKRRAQRCIQNGDLDGALGEYEKLVDSEESDPYNYVLLADLLFKKGDQGGASERYLAAVNAYEKASLYKNAIAVCKKMLRLSLSPSKVLQSLGQLHALDGLSGEAALYYVQYAEHLVRSNLPADAAKALRQAFDVCQDNIRVLEQLSEAWLLAGDNAAAAAALVEAAGHYRARGAEADARRCSQRAVALDERAGAAAEAAIASPPPAPAPESAPAPISLAAADPEPADVTPEPSTPEPGARDFTPIETVERQTSKFAGGLAAADFEQLAGFETGRHEIARPSEPGARPAEAPEESAAHAALDEPAHRAQAPHGGAMRPPKLSAPGAPIEADDGESVYEIPAEDAAELASIDGDAPAESVYVIDAEPDEAVSELSPHAPGLAFGSTPPAAPAHAHEDEHQAMQRVEALLAQAQQQFRSGDRDLAARSLADAAQAYEQLGRLDNAATIYRSLGHGAQAAPAVLELWLANCERRGDSVEAAQVACELGDRAINESDDAAACSWFERALLLDSTNETAARRLQRLRGDIAPQVDAPFAAVLSPSVVPGVTGELGEMGRVEVAVGRAEAVSFDLAGLLSEFQRGVEAQLAGDAQSHYDLGMTYREMGLLEQAVEAFRFAQTDPGLAARAHEMIGRCFCDQGRNAEAAGEFRRALALPGIAEGGDAELRYHLGNALAESGEAAAALAEYESVASQLPGFEDVDARIAALRRVMGLA